MRGVNVVLDHPAVDTFILLSCFNVLKNLFYLTTEENPPTLGQTIRLHDVRQSLELLAISWLLKLILEVDDIAREYPSLREEIELVWEGTFHAHQVPS